MEANAGDIGETVRVFDDREDRKPDLSLSSFLRGKGLSVKPVPHPEYFSTAGLEIMDFSDAKVRPVLPFIKKKIGFEIAYVNLCGLGPRDVDVYGKENIDRLHKLLVEYNKMITERSPTEPGKFNLRLRTDNPKVCSRYFLSF